jgi:hypothetical protein
MQIASVSSLGSVGSGVVGDDLGAGLARQGRSAIRDVLRQSQHQAAASNLDMLSTFKSFGRGNNVLRGGSLPPLRHASTGEGEAAPPQPQQPAKAQQPRWERHPDPINPREYFYFNTETGQFTRTLPVDYFSSGSASIDHRFVMTTESILPDLVVLSSSDPKYFASRAKATPIPTSSFLVSVPPRSARRGGSE